MKHVTIADKSLLVGDGAAALLIQCATLLGKAGSADNVSIRSLGIDGELVEAHFLLNSGTVLMSESTHSALPEPDNSDAEQYMQEQIDEFESYALPDDGLEDETAEA